MHSQLDLASWLLALEATELISEPVTQMALKLIISFQYSKSDKNKNYILLHVHCTVMPEGENIGGPVDPRPPGSGTTEWQLCRINT